MEEQGRSGACEDRGNSGGHGSGAEEQRREPGAEVQVLSASGGGSGRKESEA